MFIVSKKQLKVVSLLLETFSFSHGFPSTNMIVEGKFSEKINHLNVDNLGER